GDRRRVGHGVGVSERVVLFQGGDQREQLGRGTGLHAGAAAVGGVDRVVDLGLAPAGAVRAVLGDRTDLAGARLYDGLDCGVVAWVERSVVVGLDVVRRVVRGLLVLRVERGVNLQAAGGQQLGPGHRRRAVGGIVQEDFFHVLAEEARTRGDRVGLA